MSKIKIGLIFIAITTILASVMPLKAIAATTEALQEIKISRDSFSLNVNESLIIEAKTDPENVNRKKTEFKSNSNVAKVEKITSGLNVESDGKLTEGNKIYYIKSKICENVISVQGDKTSDSALILTNINSNKDSQKFELIDAGNGYFIIRIKHSGKVLDLKGGKKDNSTRVIQYHLTGNDNQLWKLEDAGDGYYYIKSKHSETYLDIRRASKEPEAEIIIYTHNENTKNDNQKFKFVDTGETAKVEEFGMAKVTGIKKGTAKITATLNGIKSKECKVTVNSNPTEVTLSTGEATVSLNESVIVDANVKPDDASDKSLTFTSSNTEIATVEKAKVVGRYYIKTALNDRVITIKSVSEGKSAETIIQDNEKEDYQKFDFIDAGNGYYIIRVKDTGKVLDVQKEGTTNSTKVIQYKLTGKDNQLWKLEPAGDDYFYIKSKHSGLCLDIQGGVANNGKNIIIYKGKGSKNQKFKLVPINENTDSVVENMVKINANQLGNATITAKTKNGITAKCDIAVEICATSIKLNTNNISISEKTKSITATVTPSNVTNKKITWSSSNTSVATVKNGKITAVSPGTANITAKTPNGRADICSVIVTTNVLFVGNSKTYYNKMPNQYFAKIAQTDGKNVHVETITQNGKTLKWHYDNRSSDGAVRESSTNLAKTVTGKRWDYVVLQEKTDTSYTDYNLLKSGATSIVNFIRNNGSPNVKIIYNSIWMDLTETKNTLVTVDKIKKEVIKDSSSVYKSQKQANDNFRALKKESDMNGTIAYSGKAFIWCWRNSEGYKLQLYRESDSDWNHPSVYGSYLEAGCIYSAIFGEPSTDIIVDKVWNYKPNVVNEEYSISEENQKTLWSIIREVQ